MSTTCVFSHIILTAPSSAIADVYCNQLKIAKESVPFLRNSSVSCVADPDGFRVGSGGGTLNALQYLLKHNDIVLLQSRVLIIHSGGESRRAPLYSLIGKAWTTLNCCVEGGVIASPLMLLIREISNFSVNIPCGSIVIGSSDVMLDIANVYSDQLQFVPNCVHLVTVPESPETAKNHGVIKLCNKIDMDSDVCFVDQAVSYMQKPSIQEMVNCDALFTRRTQPCALVDTGIVIFTGSAVSILEELLHNSVISQCIDPTYRMPSCTGSSATTGSTGGATAASLRLELYTDILLALSVKDQTDFDLSVYCNRLNLSTSVVTSTSTTEGSSTSVYSQALPILWNALRHIPLQAICVCHGRFEHLGTTKEVLELLCMSNQTADTASSTTSIDTRSTATIDTHPRSSLHCKEHTHNYSKLQRFATKYNLHSKIHSITYNTSPEYKNISIEEEDSWNIPRKKRILMNSYIAENIVEIEHTISNFVIEHSILEGELNLPLTGFVSHISTPIGKDLRVNDNIMMQQVYLKRTVTTNNVVPVRNNLLFALVVLGIEDNIKGCVSSSTTCICMSHWSQFETVGIARDDCWSTNTPLEECTIWNARLFPVCSLSSTWELQCLLPDGGYQSTTRLTLNWIQDLHSIRDMGVSSEYASAITDWKAARRISLADILVYGDANRMLQWRCWLQAAQSSEYARPGRILVQLGVSNMWNILYKVFYNMITFVGICTSIRQKVDEQPCCSDDTALRLLFGLWLIRLCNSDWNSFSLLQSSLLLSEKWGKEHIAAILDAFRNCWEDIIATGDPSIPVVVVTFLKTFLWERSHLIEAVAYLREGISTNIPANMHTRAVFLAAWVLQHKPITVHSVDMVVENSEFSANKILTAVIGVLQTYKEGNRRNEESLKVRPLSEVVEDYAKRLVAQHVQYSLNSTSLAQQHISTTDTTGSITPFQPMRDMVVVTRAPVRIDLAGGWSDTPPICYETSGSVTNVAVLVDGAKPVRCASRIIEQPILEMHCKLLTAPGEYTVESFIAENWSDFQDLNCSSDQPCCLLRAVMVALRVVDLDMKDRSSLADSLMQRLHGGISLLCVSELPPGSGMGGSSVIAAAALQCLGELLGCPVSRTELVGLVSQVEQILTSGGGWQDQVGAIFGGFKVARSTATLPLTVSVEECTDIPQAFKTVFEDRVCLVYTGQQRLARNTLINALRKNALSPVLSPTTETTTKVAATVAALICGSEEAWSLLTGLTQPQQLQHTKDLTESAHLQLDLLADVLNRYWELKVEMARGSEPPAMRTLLQQLRPLCCGLSLCGAGAGGFAVLILKQQHTLQDVHTLVQSIITMEEDSNRDKLHDSNFILSVHTVKIDEIGIVSDILSNITDISNDYCWDILNNMVN